MLLWQTLGQQDEATREAPDETHTKVEASKIDHAYVIREYGHQVQRQLQENRDDEDL